MVLGVRVGRTKMSQFIASLPTFHFIQYASIRPFCTNRLTELETHFFFSIIHSPNIQWVFLMFQTLCGVLEIQWTRQEDGAGGRPQSAYSLVREAGKK